MLATPFSRLKPALAARLAKQTAAVSYACHWVSLMGPVLKHEEWASMICKVALACEQQCKHDSG